MSQPECILRELARECRREAYTRALQAKLQALAASNRRAAASARRRLLLTEFHSAHSGLPQLFSHAEVDDLNRCRPANDQLERLPTGLLKHHCCFPACASFLKDLRSQADRDADANAQRACKPATNRRNGLFRHLSPWMWPEAEPAQAYVPLLHSVGQSVRLPPEGFPSECRDKLQKQLVQRSLHLPALQALTDNDLRQLSADLRRIGAHSEHG